MTWFMLLGVWPIGLLIYATVLNSETHLVDGYRIVCRCLVASPFGGERDGKTGCVSCFHCSCSPLVLCLHICIVTPQDGE